MNTYRVIRKSDSAVVMEYSAEGPIEFTGFEFNLYDHVQVATNSAPAVDTSQPVKITNLAFLNRFTDAEAVRIDLASIGATVQAATMRRYMQKVNAASYIDLHRADTRGGVLSLEAAGLLDYPGRASVILDTPPAEDEKYRGA